MRCRKTLLRSGRVGRGSGRGGSFDATLSRNFGRTAMPSPGLRALLSQWESNSDRLNLRQVFRRGIGALGLSFHLGPSERNCHAGVLAGIPTAPMPGR